MNILFHPMHQCIVRKRQSQVLLQRTWNSLYNQLQLVFYMTSMAIFADLHKKGEKKTFSIDKNNVVASLTQLST